MTAAQEAQQLDSVTDIVQEKEMDESKAKDAMTALSTASAVGSDAETELAKIEVSKEDVAVIVEELEVREDVAVRALREVLSEGSVGDGHSAVSAALRKLVVS